MLSTVTESKMSTKTEEEKDKGVPETLIKHAKNPSIWHRYVWAFIQILAIGYCIAALKLAYEKGTVASFDFVVVWLLVLVVLLSIGGTCFLCKHKTGKLHLGIFIGVSAMMSNLMLIISIMTGQDLATRDADNIPSQQESAVAVLAVFCFLAYGILAILMFHFRENICPTSTNFVELSHDGFDDAVTYGEEKTEFDSLNV